MTFLVTGAAGFIGSNLVRLLRRRYPESKVLSVDALTYAGNLDNLASVWADPKHAFVKGDVADVDLMRQLVTGHEVDTIFHLAAESHVDRSIVGPMAFVKTNVEGTASVLTAATDAWKGRDDVRFVHVSTDEVFGSLGVSGRFDEQTPYAPRSPYSASKAASDHLVRAWHATYDLPVLLTNCSNNYGPHQFPEKLLPVVINRAIADEPVPVYGRGANVRDWIHVNDHCEALVEVFEQGRVGETYCIGGECEIANIDLVEKVLDHVDVALGREVGTGRRLIRFVADRPGHDFRYAMSIDRIRDELGWEPRIDLDTGLAATIAWYVDHRDWCERVRSGESRAFEEQWYEQRLSDAEAGQGAPDNAEGDSLGPDTIEMERTDILDRLNASGLLERFNVGPDGEITRGDDE